MLAGTPPLAIATGGQIESVSRRARLSAGLVPVEIEYTRRGGEVALLTVEWNSGSGRAILAAPSLLATPTTVPPSPLLWVSRGVDLAYLAAVLGLVALLAPAFAKPAAPSTSSTSPHSRIRELRHPSERAILAGLLAVVFAYAALSSHGLNDRVVLLDGGSDWLTYETYARDILQNGPLMTLGRPLGKGRPYFFQPFYPYALAAAHWLTGEDIYGVVVLQLFGLGVSAVLVYELGKRLFGRLSATFALLCVLLVLGPLQLEWVATRLLSENIFFILLPATALAFIELGRRPSRRLSVLAGLLLGLCCITRGPTLLWIPPLLLIAWSRLRRTSATAPEHSVQNTASAIAGRTAGGRVVGLAALACLAVLLLVPLRNVIVSGQPSPLASNAVSTMELAHPLTPRVDLHDVERNPLYRALRLDYSLIQMIEFVRQDPLGYAATLVPLGLYALGLPGALEPGEPIRWELVALVALYITSFALRPWTIDDRRSTIEENSERSTFYGPSSTVWVLHSFIGLHFVTMMVFLPNSYGYRQVLPMYLFLAIFAGFVLARLTAPLAGLETRASKLIGDGGAQRHRVDQHVPAANTPSRHEELA
jgi:hypothetical protein